MVEKKEKEGRLQHQRMEQVFNRNLVENRGGVSIVSWFNACPGRSKLERI